MASTEDKAYEIMRELDVNYVLVIFGGLTGYSSDGKDNFWLYFLICENLISTVALFADLSLVRIHPDDIKLEKYC